MHYTSIQSIENIDNGLKITYKSLFDFNVILTATNVIESNLKTYFESHDFIYDSTFEFGNDFICFYELDKEKIDTMFITAKSFTYEMVNN